MLSSTGLRVCLSGGGNNLSHYAYCDSGRFKGTEKYGFGKEERNEEVMDSNHNGPFKNFASLSCCILIGGFYTW